MFYFCVWIGDYHLQNMYMHVYIQYIQYDTTAVGHLHGVCARSLELLVHPL